MSPFRIARTVPLTPEEAWRRVTDWPAHGALVPLTRTTVLPGPGGGVGTRFSARTGLGPLAFEDPMEVTVWEPPAAGRPGRCRLVKYGRLVRGWALIEVYGSGGGARVEWLEDLRVRGLPRAFDPVLERAGRRVFGRALDALLAGPDDEGPAA
ncbi:SRPBCC family protein [Streptomyces sp. NPDC001941]|uniref:SRPBCC family protein n=1 Tax=Streptomyces sp. NPDC001941 TaxID=3154659 RepID=UPI003326E598